jgi:hypothetical protein
MEDKFYKEEYEIATAKWEAKLKEIKAGLDKDLIKRRGFGFIPKILKMHYKKKPRRMYSEDEKTKMKQEERALQLAFIANHFQVGQSNKFGKILEVDSSYLSILKIKYSRLNSTNRNAIEETITHWWSLDDKYIPRVLRPDFKYGGESWVDLKM